MGKKSSLTRDIALEVLMELEDENQKLHILVRGVLEKYGYMDRRDRAFMQYLIEGTVARRITLDYIIDMYAKTKNGKIKPIIRNILRLSIFQIMYMDSVPDSAACNEAVNLACDHGLAGLKGFVNGVLRTVAREKNNIKWPEKNDVNMYYSAFYSMPPWIVKYLIGLYGEEQATRILKASLDRSPVCIRINEKLADKEAILRELKDAGSEPLVHPYISYVYTINNVEAVTGSNAFKEGKITIQDISSVMAIELAGIKEGDYVIDMCAAPGGKSVHAALKCGSSGHVEARELQENKLYLIEENARRMRQDNIEVICHDALSFDESAIDKADVVICDVPCSGLGVMGRKCDIRYNTSKKSIKELALLGQGILDNACRYVKPGGLLLYSTCTITKEENLMGREYIIGEKGFVPVSIEERLPDALKGSTGEQGYIQLLQGVHESDGFFISLYRRVK